jgi:hypothetical protein
MEVVLGTLVITYYVGWFVTMFVLPRRVGLNRHAWPVAFMHPPSRRNGIPWAIVSVGKMSAWPIVLAFWLLNDQPPSRVLYGPAAAERLYGDPERALPGFLTKWKAS